MKNLVTAVQRLVLLVPVDEEQLGHLEAQEPQGQGEAHSVSKSSGRPPLKGSANDLPAHVGTCPILGVSREEQKEEEVLPATSVSRSHDRVAERGPYVKVNHPSSITSSSNVHFSSLKSGFPMCGPTPEPRVRSSLIPAAEELEPWPSLFRRAFSICGAVALHPMCWPCLWLGPSPNVTLQVGFLGSSLRAVDPTRRSCPRPKAEF